ncbi:MAG: UDP-N-acetylmuramate--L-alanine ligase [Cyanobacteria bacterium NC_groundwater_1444_Ag_S-0.65um_54_12]|nr:UDP-N-acetylmuramate--L-alanine ligase [Cyanobacteria bacterium NC_groundwater_1444_Ag_S-0.65um_54_12]
MRIPSQLHFVGIGGVGMSAVAAVWHERGGSVSGSDLHLSPITKRLQAKGISIYNGHHRENVQTLLEPAGQARGGIVVSTAVPIDNPEVAAAREQGIPIFHRSEILAALMASGRSIAVTGTHGKTTTTGMVGTLLLEGGLDPTILIGGDLPLIGGNSRTGKGDLLVAESDESDRSILRLTAEWVIVTKIEGDHLDHYRDVDDIIETLATWINRLPRQTTVIACLDDPGVQKLLGRIDRRYITYGWNEAADHVIAAEQLSANSSSFLLDDIPFEVRVPGRHNIANAAAAIVTAGLAGLEPLAIRAGLLKFGGVGRRFQVRGNVAGIQLIEDYAHHPSEIRATLAAAKLIKRPVWVIFQPHRYSRTSALLDEFVHAFDEATAVAVMDIYSAGEVPNGISSRDLVERVHGANPNLKVYYWADHRTAEEGASRQLKSGDIVILMGAGNVNSLVEPLLECLRLREAAVSIPPA